MDTGVGPDGEAAEATGESRVPRRGFLRSLVAWGAGIAAVGVGVPEANALRQGTRAAGTAAAATGTRLRRWAMVIDLRRCDGCQAIDEPPRCTQACIQGHLAPEPMQWIEVYEAPLPGGGTQFIPSPCMQCQNPPCVNVCPVGATFSTPEGIVLVDQMRCIGCRICMEACPYDRRFFNWGSPPIPREAALTEYSAEHEVPAIRGTVMKCEFCPDLARGGRRPYCSQACPNGCIYYGDLEEDLATNGREVVRLSRFLSKNTAFRLKEELGTDPRVFYIPGYGQDVGRSPYRRGLKRILWPWRRVAAGSERWGR